MATKAAGFFLSSTQFLPLRIGHPGSRLSEWIGFKMCVCVCVCVFNLFLVLLENDLISHIFVHKSLFYLVQPINCFEPKS